MRKLIVILLVMSANAVLWAAARSPQQAVSIAGTFMHTRAAANGKHCAPSASHPQIVVQGESYYAVNTDGSFVLVSADDRLPEVLGYSDSGTFDTDNMSPAMRYWLACYDEELASISNQQSASGNMRRAVPAVEPLMTSKWNQSSPYNDLAPMYNDNGGQCVTGCVATAMAQVMYFYRYPQKGIGSHSYLWICTEPAGKSGTLSANFGNTTYDWANMLDSYRFGYTDVQARAVATLMYHCGVSIDMGYGQSSGAYTEQVPVALKDYFGYDANYQRIRKIMYPADSLNAIIAAELSADRPVIVSGSNDEGGHAFVCDGCDTRGYFHINWGWGGSNDGYYLLTALNPGRSQGIGGTTKGYNKGTSFFVGLQPAQTNSPKAIPQMATTKFTVSSESFNRTSSFSVSILKMQNYGLTNFSGSYGVGLYNEDETQLVSVLKQENNYSLDAGYYRTTAAGLNNIYIPNNVPSGTYHLCAIYKDVNYGWMRMMCTDDDYYKTVEVSGNSVTFYANDAAAELSLTSPLAFPEGTNPDSVPKTGIPVSFSIRNTGGTFRGDISARVYKGSFAKGQYEIMDSIVIRRNQSLSSALQQKFDAALELNQQYKMKLCWRAGEGDSWHEFEGPLSFKLYDPEYHLSLTDTIRFDCNDSVPRSNANLYYSIRNTGAPFDGDLQVSFYQTYFSRGKSEIREVHIGTNDTLIGAFSGPLEQEAGIYHVVLRYRDKEGDWQDFIDINDNNIGAIVATIYDDSVPTAISNELSPINNQRFLMHLGAYDLYIITTREGSKLKYKKIFKPVQ